ncbi:stage II sporulation protein P [Alkaliphilus sp. MSJ-5]|uniref:Stage II sporulation protein P n=1 Tax=Alkaliphilus flagellatus TaxID=2841507 RepID=A0ABS6FZH7_9FIRM|nr:stage II sporulation protein P [Alkaliphilus flagellatus]MBU5675655.1 stage II sporulation protein P [Alkaliphilus flagellatus]
MSHYKKKLPRSYYNIIILLLILLVLFSMVRLISNKESLVLTNNESYQSEVFKLDRDEKVDNNFLIKTLQHMFPNRKVEKQYKPVFSFKEVYTSFFNSIFIIDFKNPLTFVQAQFPVVIAHHETLMANIPQNDNYEEIEEDWSREIHFVDYDGEEKTVTVDTNIDSEYYIDKNELTDQDDIGEIEEGIYVVGEESVVDSLNPISNGDLANIPRPKSIAIEKDKPSILIYHTHGTESYNPATEGNFHSLRKEYTVIAVADIVTKELEKRGYNVIHDYTYHDYPSYNGSYGRSVVTAKGILEKNPSIKVVLDIHRDGYDKITTRSDRLSLIENSRTKINGEYVARFQFVIGGKTKNRKEVESFAHFVKAVSDSKYPGFSKEPLVNRYGSYNQFLTDNAALIELGSNTNTIEEAKKAGYYLADVLGDALKLLEE